MEASEHQNVLRQDEVLRDFQSSFFVMSRLASFPWTFVKENLHNSKSPELISKILQQTCLHPLCRKFPPSVRYRRLFLSELIRRQEEASDCDPLDELYDALAEVVGAPETSECFKSYLLPCGRAVSLQENVALISQGTTGLVTWEAALYLAEWALDHQEVFTGRTVLELGSGVGLTGATICRSCKPNRFIFSDCHSSVLQKLRDNIQINELMSKDDSPPLVSVEKLDWTDTSEEKLREIAADIVIAADVVYDPEVADCLVTLLSRILRSSCSQPEVFICSTVRNPETYAGFKLQLENTGIQHEVIPGPVSPVFPYNRDSTIELIKLYLNTNAV